MKQTSDNNIDLCIYQVLEIVASSCASNVMPKTRPGNSRRICKYTIFT